MGRTYTLRSPRPLLRVKKKSRLRKVDRGSRGKSTCFIKASHECLVNEGEKSTVLVIKRKDGGKDA